MCQLLQCVTGVLLCILILQIAKSCCVVGRLGHTSEGIYTSTILKPPITLPSDPFFVWLVA